MRRIGGGSSALLKKSVCSPDAAPVQDVLHATAHGGVAADLQRIAWAHCQDEIVLTQRSLHATEGISHKKGSPQILTCCAPLSHED